MSSGTYYVENENSKQCNWELEFSAVIWSLHLDGCFSLSIYMLVCKLSCNADVLFYNMFALTRLSYLHYTNGLLIDYWDKQMDFPLQQVLRLEVNLLELASELQS